MKRTQSGAPGADSARLETTTGASSRGGWSLLVFFLFFLSGLTSLIYEVIWVRKFGFVFGVSTYAVSTVLAAFFAGLAIGSYVAGRIIDRTKLHPLVVYGVMEGLVGVYALLLPLLLAGVEASYPAIYTRIGESFQLFTLYRFLIAFVLLVIPTILMGATLPVLSKLMVDRETVLGFNVGTLYAINTFGAVAGSVGAGFLLIPALGVPKHHHRGRHRQLPALAACALAMSRLRPSRPRPPPLRRHPRVQRHRPAAAPDSRHRLQRRPRHTCPRGGLDAEPGADPRTHHLRLRHHAHRGARRHRPRQRPLRPPRRPD